MPCWRPRGPTNEPMTALLEGRHADVVREWQTAARLCRGEVDSLMNFALAREEAIPPEMRRYLLFPYSIRNIKNLRYVPDPGGPWHYVRRFEITGPFPLGMANVTGEEVPEGFTHVYPPEQGYSADARFETVDGPTGWRTAGTDVSALLDFLDEFATTADVLCYARCVVVAPEDMDVVMGFGSNDGARVWVNDDMVFELHKGRRASQNNDSIPVHLRRGENVVLVKVENFGASWGLYLSFEDPERRLEYRPE